MANKTFFTYDEQIEKLEKEKQLVISDPEFAKTTLQKLGYFSLIGGYKDYIKLDIENPIIRINTAFKGCSSLEKISVLPRIYHN